MILDHECFEGEQLILGFFFFDTNCLCMQGRKVAMHIEVAAQIIYLIILIVILIFGLRLRKRKNNNSSVNVASDVTSNTQITIEPTCLALNSTMACWLPIYLRTGRRKSCSC